ncbi:MAG: asparagine synthase B [Candidatus Scalindua sp.]
MCGILGIFGKVNKNESYFNAMLQTLQHRGPDDNRTVTGTDYFLGHQRLSIVDVEGGSQPLESNDGNMHLVCNGEIYNHQNLRNQSAYNYSSDSDSEVIIPLYQEKGSEFVEGIDGMFSFIISEGERFFVARDPIGIKPLYWGFDDTNIYFSSEIKALINTTDRISEFPKGSYFDSNEGFKTYYQLPQVDVFITDIDKAIEKIKKTLKKSVKKRLMSDVPVGVFLSGGLDSSIIAALMKEEIPELHSFSVGLSESPDIKAARMVAQHLGTIHHEYVYSEDEMRKELADVIYYLESYDQALVRSAVPCYFVSRLASQYVKVVLSGEGADELFAGYSYLEEYDEPQELHSESIRILSGLHNINLQRVDRMTMSHGLEGRVPFLDIEFIETVLSISPELKIQSTFGKEKWLLRKAFEDLLPAEIVWRNKLEFAQGCGSSTFFEQETACITDKRLHEAKEQGIPITTKEELYYYDIFNNHMDHPDAVNLVGRWKGALH